VSSDGGGGLRGLRVVALESRRAEVMEELIRYHGGDAFVAPSVKEIPFAQHEEVFGWAERLRACEFELIVLMTGVGLSFLREMVPDLAAALRRVTIVARGPKPVEVLGEMGLAAQVALPEPNTWHEIVSVIEARPERRITVQEYGLGNPDFMTALGRLGAEVTPLAIYKWALPDDLRPLREAVRRIAEGECDVVLFTTSIQLTHLLRVAQETGHAQAIRTALREQVAIGSVGPVMDAALADHGFAPDIVPTCPKMPVLVRAAAESARAVLARKRGISGGKACGVVVIRSRH
jgi:uroporphyrinogen-III synthase